jgi:DNA mismatch endonuclease (patch repair protein)
MPATRPEFWRVKIEGNAARDQLVLSRLTNTSWRVLVIWECALRGTKKLKAGMVLDAAASFIQGDAPLCEIKGDEQAMR